MSATDLTLTKQDGVVIETDAYAPTSYAREPGSAVSTNRTYVHEQATAVYAPEGAATYAYNPHTSAVASGGSSQDFSGQYAQETSPFAHDPSPPSSAVPLTPASHAHAFVPEGYVVPSQGYANANDGYHIDQAVSYEGTPSVAGSGNSGAAEYPGSVAIMATESAGPSTSHYAAYNATRKYSVDSSTHTSFRSPEFSGPSYNASLTTHAGRHDHIVDSAGFVSTSKLAQAPVYEYQYPSPPGTAQSQGHIIAPQSPSQQLSQLQPPPLQAHHQLTSAHARHRSASTSSFAGTSYALPVSFYQEFEGTYDGREGGVVGVSAEPSFAFTRQTWWDSLLALYASAQSPPTIHLGAAPGSNIARGQLGLGGRRAARTAVLADVKFLFAVAPHWLFFLHVPTFYATLATPERACPALVLAVCAISTLFQRCVSLHAMVHVVLIDGSVVARSATGLMGAAAR